ncbi:MAG TPA: hypothetical protein VHV10_11375 [Ktedonobacteraceae bacterium]|nr:hypothetical protein [Ktedonobacteraceae bacterium]
MTNIGSRASFTLGRPFTLDSSDITVSKPGPTRQDSGAGTHTDIQEVNGQLLPFSFSVGDMQDLGGLVTQQRIVLSDMVEAMSRAVLVYKTSVLRLILTLQSSYGSSDLSIDELQVMSENTVLRMFTWKKNIPEALKIPIQPGASVLPQILVLQ